MLTILTTEEFNKYLNTLRNNFERVDDRGNIIICYGYEPAIDQYVADVVLQLINIPNENGKVEVSTLSRDGWYESKCEELLAEALA